MNIRFHLISGFEVDICSTQCINELYIDENVDVQQITSEIKDSDFLKITYQNSKEVAACIPTDKIEYVEFLRS